MKKTVLAVAAAITVLGSASAFAASTGASGGWEEGKGYFKDRGTGVSIDVVREYPERHEGTTESNGSSFERCVARTWWKGVRHYSRAQLTWLGEVRLDSDRQWAYDYTYAATGYGRNELVARTFWGKDLN